MRVLLLYDSLTGNTEKVAKSIEEALKGEGTDVERLKVSAVSDEFVELHDYDLVFLGSPVIQFMPTKAMVKFCQRHLAHYLKKGVVIPKSPKIEGKFAVAFVTYGGMHTGIREAIPALKYLEQFLEHLRYTVVDEFYVVGAYKTPEFEKYNTETVLGDITGRPNDEDLAYAARKAKEALKKAQAATTQRALTDYKPLVKSFLEGNYPEIGALMGKMLEKTSALGALSERELVLIMIAIACCTKCRECLKFHIAKALGLGVTPEEIKGVVLAGLLPAGASYLNFAVEVLKELGIY